MPQVTCPHLPGGITGKSYFALLYLEKNFYLGLQLVWPYEPKKSLPQLQNPCPSNLETKCPPNAVQANVLFVMGVGESSFGVDRVSLS